jgi:hypothetical protein
MNIALMSIPQHLGPVTASTQRENQLTVAQGVDLLALSGLAVNAHLP